MQNLYKNSPLVTPVIETILLALEFIGSTPCFCFCFFSPPDKWQYSCYLPKKLVKTTIFEAHGCLSRTIVFYEKIRTIVFEHFGVMLHFICSRFSSLIFLDVLIYYTMFNNYLPIFHYEIVSFIHFNYFSLLLFYFYNSFFLFQNESQIFPKNLLYLS